MKYIKQISHYTLLFLSIIALSNCGTKEVVSVQPEAEPNNENIEVTAAQFELSNMELGTLSKHPFHSAIKLNGMLDVPPEYKSTVSAYFGGYVKYISLLEGKKVSKGQTLFTLENPSYIEVQQKYLEAKSKLKYLKADYERQQSLAQNQVNSQKTLLKAESEYKSTLALFNSLHKKLQLMNVNPNSLTEDNLTTTISVRAPISGYVTSVLATKGKFLNPSDVAVTILNTDHLHVELTLYEKELAKVKKGQEVSVTIQGSNSPYVAEVFMINRALHPENRSVTVHCHFKDEQVAKTLTPGMSVQADIYTLSDSAIALPKEAIISVEKENFILLLKEQNEGNYSFEKKNIQIGKSHKGYTEILNPGILSDSDKILVKGAYNLIQ